MLHYKGTEHQYIYFCFAMFSKSQWLIIVNIFMFMGVQFGCELAIMNWARLGWTSLELSLDNRVFGSFQADTEYLPTFLTPAWKGFHLPGSSLLRVDHRSTRRWMLTGDASYSLGLELAHCHFCPHFIDQASHVVGSNNNGRMPTAVSTVAWMAKCGCLNATGVKNLEWWLYIS